MPKDKNGNDINVTLFETYFCKYLIENPKFFKPVYLKILTKIEEIIALNQSDKTFNRIMFTITSLMMQEFKTFKTISELKDNFDLFSANYFLKIFCDSIIKQNLIINVPKELNSTFSSLSVCAQNTLFHDPKQTKLFRGIVNAKELFHLNQRGVRELQSQDKVVTKKLGITTIENTPENLLNYFDEEYEPSQYDYIPDRTSNVGKWLSQRNLPIITGASGTARDYLTSLLEIVRLDPKEIQLLIISSAASLVSKGHHSYFEVLMLLERVGFKLQEAPDLYTFYEQTLPQSISKSESYLQFKDSEVGSKLLINTLTEIDETEYYDYNSLIF